MVKGLDKASPALALLAVTNRVIPTATIFLSKLGDAPIDFFTAVLENVVVGTAELVEVDGGLTPTERVTLLPTRATLTYVQKPAGPPGQHRPRSSHAPQSSRLALGEKAVRTGRCVRGLANAPATVSR